MNTETPPTHDELVEKLEAWAGAERILALSNLNNRRANCSDKESILRATIAELKRGQEGATFLQWLLANCKIIHWPDNGHYPIEHSTAANKDSALFLKMAMNKQGMYAQPPAPYYTADGKPLQYHEVSSGGGCGAIPVEPPKQSPQA